MAGILKGSINLSAIPKDKIIAGKKGQYLPVTITFNDEIDQFGNQGPIIVEQTKEERDAKAPKTYLGNIKIVWTNVKLKRCLDKIKVCNNKLTQLYHNHHQHQIYHFKLN